MSFNAQPLERTGRSDRIILQAKDLAMKFEDSDTEKIQTVADLYKLIEEYHKN